MTELAVGFSNFADTPKDVMNQAASFDRSGEFHVCSLYAVCTEGMKEIFFLGGGGQRTPPVFVGWFAGSSVNVI